MKFLIVFIALASMVMGGPSKRSDDVTVVDSDDCYDELSSCSALIQNGGMDCSQSGAQDFCRKSCDSCGASRKKRSGLETKKIDVCYDELAYCATLIKIVGMDCSKSGAQEF